MACLRSFYQWLFGAADWIDGQAATLAILTGSSLSCEAFSSSLVTHLRNIYVCCMAKPPMTTNHIPSGHAWLTKLRTEISLLGLVKLGSWNPVDHMG